MAPTAVTTEENSCVGHGPSHRLRITNRTKIGNTVYSSIHWGQQGQVLSASAKRAMTQVRKCHLWSCTSRTLKDFCVHSDVKKERVQRAEPLQENKDLRESKQ